MYLVNILPLCVFQSKSKFFVAHEKTFAFHTYTDTFESLLYKYNVYYIHIFYINMNKRNITESKYIMIFIRKKFDFTKCNHLFMASQINFCINWQIIFSLTSLQ